MHPDESGQAARKSDFESETNEHRAVREESISPTCSLKLMLKASIDLEWLDGL